VSDASHPANQILIVRRNYDGEEAHHGGVWKIAFADFMTAMMAFFLVMWLTNASDDATKKKIAQYFNPIKLNSSSPETLGLDKGENTPSAPSSNTVNGEVEDGGNPNEKPMSGTATGGQEQALFRDPYAVLAEIAAQGGAGTQDGVSGVPNGTGLPGLNGGDAYRDPFDPTSWQLQPNAEEKAAKDTAMTPSEFQQPPAQALAELPQTKTVAEVVQPPAPAAADAAGVAAANAPMPSAAAAAAEAAEQAMKNDAATLKAEIQKTIETVAPGTAPNLDVSAGKDGITISLADSVTSGMFEVGSAKPTAEAVRLVEGIAKLLAERPGEVVVRGHTDSRPYAGAEYDNWRLSAARAQFAYYMLVNGGLDQNRVQSIEGVADRDPKDAAHPESAVNRRIEILLKEPQA
jgi:chemotaxis protein MotB